MANLKLHSAATLQEQKAIIRKDLECLVKYIAKFGIDDNHLFGCKFVFKYGLPGKWPSGKWGFLYQGNVGVIWRNQPDPIDWRAAPRNEELPEYVLELQSLYRILAPITEYYGRDYIELRDAKRIIRNHLRALTKSIPLYYKYLLYKIFAGTKVKASNNWYIKQWIERYIEPTNGDTQGYPFYFHQAHKEINLKKIITKQDVKVHPLKKRLEAINSALRNDSRKIEVDYTKDALVASKSFVKNNITPTGRAIFALYHKAREECARIVRNGQFESKYKHMTSEGAAKWLTRNGEAVTDDVPIEVSSGSELIVLFNDEDWTALMQEVELVEPFGKFIDTQLLKAQFKTTDLLDRGECFILHKDLIQIWILPTTVRYQEFDYKQLYEETKDYFYAIDHSIDIVPFHASVYLKLKQDLPIPAAA